MDIDMKNRKSAPKKGRRAGLSFFSLSIKDSGNQNDSDNKEFVVPSSRERSGGWDDDSVKNNNIIGMNLHGEDQVGNSVRDFDDGIPVIPNLEDNIDDEFITQIAKAPLIGINRVASYKELERELLKHAAFSNLEEVNLRILTNHLYPESALLEPDEPWTRDSLLSEVISVMNDERDKEIK